MTNKNHMTAPSTSFTISFRINIFVSGPFDLANAMYEQNHRTRAFLNIKKTYNIKKKYEQCFTRGVSVASTPTETETD